MSDKKVYSEEEVQKATLEYFEGDSLAADVWMKKYALKDKESNFLEKTPDDMHHRLAREFARIEKKYPKPLSEEEIYEALKGFKHLVCQGSPMAGIGNEYNLSSLSNCYAIESPHDSYSGILRTDEQIVQISKNRGGVGTDVSTLRPKGLPVNNAAKTTDGIGVFIQRYSNTIREVGQHGRRGALLLSLHCQHPEVETFINIKRDRTKVTGANLSVKWTDEFLEAVEKNEEIELRFPIDSDDCLVRRKANAKEIWEQFVSSSWECAEPGCLFIGNVEKNDPSWGYLEFRPNTTNPCGEQWLAKDNSCLLFIVNLFGFVKNKFTQESSFDFDRFHEFVKIATRLADDQVDLEEEKILKIIQKIEKDKEPEELKRVSLSLWKSILEKMQKSRRVGIGVTGLGDCLAALGYKYGSEVSIETTEQIYRVLSDSSYLSSIALASERGAFPAFDAEKEVGCLFLQRLYENYPNFYEETKKVGRRNLLLLTTPPAGSVSILTQTSSGIEPVIFLESERKRKLSSKEIEEGIEPTYVDDVGEKWISYRVQHKPYQEWKALNPDAKVSPYDGHTALEIPWKQSIDIQAAAQAWVDNSISKTINLPKEITKEEISQLFLYAWKRGLKGCTIYREGSRDAVISSLKNKQENGKATNPFNITKAPKRPPVLKCDIHRAKIKGEEWTIFVGLLDSRPYEIFAGLSDLVEIPAKYTTGVIEKTKFKSRSRYDLVFGEDTKIKDIAKVFNNPTEGVMTRLISLALRHGSLPSFVVEQLNRSEDGDFSSFAKVIARILKKYIKDGERVSGTDKTCPQCNSEGTVVYQEGCLLCTSCGYSKCG